MPKIIATSQHGFLDHGGSGMPIVLVHGLMGRGRTWFRHIPWLTNYGRVFTYDAAFHQGKRYVPKDDSIATERFVADLAEILYWIDRGPAILIGHSMGGLHAWCAAAQYPELVYALVVEDMIPDFTGLTVDPWKPYFNSWPNKFVTKQQCYEFFGPVAGRYFWESFDHGTVHGDVDKWQQIAQYWATKPYWDEWKNVLCPTLLIEADNGIGKDSGQIAQMVNLAKNLDNHIVVNNCGHIIHDEMTTYFRGSVEAFLANLVRI